ncbi:MAG: hypothetical protein IPM89_01990 [Candidatus Competibacteraceae bacterium]|nr:MAG: hypothetical protein IPM89_01990 [Candidatus Competibacteraceae bacterium]
MSFVNAFPKNTNGKGETYPVSFKPRTNMFFHVDPDAVISHFIFWILALTFSRTRLRAKSTITPMHSQQKNRRDHRRFFSVAGKRRRLRLAVFKTHCVAAASGCGGCTVI